MSLVLRLLLIVLVPLTAEATAVPRPGQPYAEGICNTDPNVIFCEDFNYPANFSGTADQGVWVNAGLSQGANSGAQITGRHIIPANGQGTYVYPTKPTGNAHSIGGCSPPFIAAGCDHVFVANFDTTFDDHVVGNSNMFGQLRFKGGNYMNGMTPAKDFFVRFQMYMTPNWMFVGDPKLDTYNFTDHGVCPNCGVGQSLVDQKIFFVYPPEVFNTPGGCSPTDCSYDGGFYFTSSSFHNDGGYANPSGARFSDALFVRTGTGGVFDWFPLCNDCHRQPTFLNYGPYNCRTNTACLGTANDTPTPGQVWRTTRNVWYTFELRYVLSSTPGGKDGRVVVWVTPPVGAPGGGITTQIYDSGATLETCSVVGQVGWGDCSGLGAILVTSYHNGAETTPLNGQTLYDNLVVSKAPIGPPVGGGGTPPAAPTNLHRIGQVNLGVKLVDHELVLNTR